MEIFRKMFVLPNEERRRKSLVRQIHPLHTKTLPTKFSTPQEHELNNSFHNVLLPFVWLPLLAQLGFDDIRKKLEHYIEVKHEPLLSSEFNLPARSSIVVVARVNSIRFYATVSLLSRSSEKGKIFVSRWWEEKSIKMSGVCFSLLEGNIAMRKKKKKILHGLEKLNFAYIAKRELMSSVPLDY